MLKGDALMTQVDKWVRQGVIELDCGHAIQHVVRTKEWLDLSDRCQSSPAGCLHCTTVLSALSSVAVTSCCWELLLPWALCWCCSLSEPT